MFLPREMLLADDVGVDAGDARAVDGRAVLLRHHRRDLKAAATGPEMVENARE